MPRTRLYRTLDTQPDGIPADAACPDSSVPPVTVPGEDDAIKPARRRLTGLLDIFAAFPSDFMSAGRGEQEQTGR
ncbi:conserved hypothetical protein [Cupriavidus necator]|uniref:Uncharacterized protein n=1 Tax=Cupriavidus necator TaxID=106590 RepID=A0A1K0J4R6_CUPNE|nr:conserved hypothetical protein [Cupriavidus necator]